ncbi:MAG TPA: hypothetical protein PLW86_15960, partial [Rhodocyclaceae bacterium]|nr:hypothetical protein [Rhodocyclaceae bacterium]
SAGVGGGAGEACGFNAGGLGEVGRGRSMNAADLPTKEATTAHIAGCFAIIGKQLDPFAAKWATLDKGGRRVLLMAAELPQSWASRSWYELTESARVGIRRRIPALQKWLDRVMQGGSDVRPQH